MPTYTIILRHPDAGEHVATVDATTPKKAEAAAREEAILRRGGDAAGWEVFTPEVEPEDVDVKPA